MVANDAPPTAPTALRPVSGLRRYGIWWCLGLVVGLTLAAILGWYGWRRYAAPVPPEIPLPNADPAVAAAVETAIDKVRRDPYSEAAWGNLGKLLRACEIKGPAAACFAQAERLDPTEPRWPYLQGEVLLLTDAAAALPHLERAVAIGDQKGTDTIAPRLRLAEALLARGQNAEAEGHLRRALQAEPDNPAVNLHLGFLAFARDDLEASRTHLLRCRFSPFTQRRANAYLAAVCQRAGDAEEAARYSRQADALPPDIHWGDPFLMECLQLAVGQAHRFRYVEQLEAQGRHREAVVVLRGMAAEGPDYRTFVALGKNLAQLGDVQGAEQALRKAIEDSPENVLGYYLLSKVLWAQAENRREKDAGWARYRYRAAADLTRQAIARKPDHALAHMIRGLCLRRLGQAQEGLAALRTAAECGPEVAEVSLRLGEALAEMGETAEARHYLERARELAKPGDPRPRKAQDRPGPTHQQSRRP